MKRMTQDDPRIAGWLPVADASELLPFVTTPNVERECAMTWLAERLGLCDELHEARQDPTGAALQPVLDTMKARII